MKKPEDIFAQIYTSYRQRESRNLKEDAQTYLKNNKIKYEINVHPGKIENIPTLIAANHHTRPLIARNSSFTTVDSIITTSLISLAANKLTSRKLIWIVKNDLKSNIFFFNLKARKTQLAAIDVYDFVGIGKGYPFGQKKKWLNSLNSGFNIAFYPEAKTSTKLKRAKPAFAEIINYLQEENITFQILPVTVYEKRKVFYVTVANPISSIGHPPDLVQETMLAIATNLPKKLRGYYKNQISNSATTGR